jgi:predicted ATPase
MDLLRDVDTRVAGIELLSPGGDVPELFVRAVDGSSLLPLSSMGEGFQRCLELGATAAAHGWPIMFIDEIENGMHHLVLDALWRWIATISRKRKLQVFATTHSDECIQAAARAFGALGDDGLRVIRLDRLNSGTRASVYDRALLETAERTGTEIRG